MSINWKNIFVFKRESNIYTFSKNPLERKDIVYHIFMPWSSVVDEELMFKVKEAIKINGSSYIPLFEIDGTDFELIDEDIEAFNRQISSQVETHLVLSNFESIHILRIAKIETAENVEKIKNDILPSFKPFLKKSTAFLRVDDLYVYDVNHVASEDNDIIDVLENFVESPQTHNIFQSFKNTLGVSEDISAVHKRWVDINRSLSYDYYIRACELEDNIYQETWPYFSKKTQHDLISSALDRHKGVFHRDIKKWEHLVSSFRSFKNALISELNAVYIRPLINAVVEYDILKEAWDEVQTGVIEKKISKLIGDLLSGEINEVESLEEFLFYIKSAKSFLFSLKNKFTKKIHKEEFLRIENFLIKQESLIESLSCRGLDKKIHSIIEIEDWIEHTNLNISSSSKEIVKDCNLKLSHLLSLMASASYTDNIFFKLIEEKAARGTVQKSFEDEVKNLLRIEVKKVA